ncbi:MAG: YkgJ family cysteine cluster protein [Candidatus Nanoarchaeia archaeon]|nr:YkgJ family cysteine cluster protein [Candidatus Nanoarchaeia archaeon]
MAKYKRIGECKLCGQCCRELSLEVEKEVKPGLDKRTAAKKVKESEINLYKRRGYTNIKCSKVTWLSKKEVRFSLELKCPHLVKNKCTIHSVNGFDKKPGPCREFPTFGVRRPEGCAYRFRKY